MFTPSRFLVACLLAAAYAALSMPGCASAYYTTMEAFGKEKRDILASRVQSARAGQTEAKEQFQSALDRFSQLVGAKDSDLRKAYDRARSDYDACESKADRVRDRVKSVESVGTDLFAEWQAEANQYTTPDLKARSLAQLQQTRARFDQMLSSMKQASASMHPVLARLKDSVLFLKHNLNAQTIAGMQGTVDSLRGEVSTLIADMERSIAEADKFVAEMN
jgi:uncharacterized coiled-coil DUF342 family protein